MTRVTVGSLRPSVQTSNRGTASEATQDQMNAGDAQGVYASPKTIQDKDDTAVALVDGATIAITGPKHTLSTATGRTFTISHAGDVGTIDILLSATSATFTFPATALCIYAGTSSGDNTLVITGATSGDHIMVGWIKQGLDYRVTGVNFGQ